MTNQENLDAIRQRDEEDPRWREGWSGNLPSKDRHALLEYISELERTPAKIAYITRDQLASVLCVHREEIVEADEWRPLAQHILDVFGRHIAKLEGEVVDLKRINDLWEEDDRRYTVESDRLRALAQAVVEDVHALAAALEPAK